jgi:hypothetical protein
MEGRTQKKGAAAARELMPGQTPALLQALHILTREGHLNADSLRKLKQVNHLARLLAPAIEDVLARFGEPVVVDCGAGKSYLGFVLYQLFLQAAGKGTLHAVEARPELVEKARALAARLGFGRMTFEQAEIGAAAPPARVHLVTALHACDTATDDALALAIRHGADHVAVVPCCQAEVADQLARAPEPAPLLATLFEHPWHRREFGSHLTNVVRALALQASGYSVTVTELAGWEHSLKNELILGKKVRAGDARARARLLALCEAAGVKPRLVRLLWPEKAGDSPPAAVGAEGDDHGAG